MNRMIGIGLMISSVLIFFTGLLLYSTSKKTVKAIPAQIQASIPIKVLEPEKEKERPDRELEKAIQMAVADGVLTTNERNIIKEIAIEKGLDHINIIKNVEQQIAESDVESETQLLDYNKKQGDDFEKFIVQKFGKNFFRIKEWAGDKYVNGVYAETTTQPDILIEIKVKDRSAEFWVECKWRQDIFKGGIEFATDEQFERYKNYQKERNIPVFVAIGVGGKGALPNQLFVVPLNKLKSNYIHLNYLNYFIKEIDKDFFYNMKTSNLN